MFSVCCECHLFGLDVTHFGVGVKVLTDGDAICFVSCGGLEDGARGCVLVTGQYRADQAVGFTRAWRSPAERTKKVIVYDGAVEIGVLKVCQGVRGPVSALVSVCDVLPLWGSVFLPPRFGGRLCEQKPDEQSADADEYNRFYFKSMVIKVLTNCLFWGHRFSGIPDWIGCRADSVSPRL